MPRTLLLMVMRALLAGREATARIVLTCGDLAARLYDLERLATPPAPGERSGCFSGWDRGGRYNVETGRYLG